MFENIPSSLLGEHVMLKASYFPSRHTLLERILRIRCTFQDRLSPIFILCDSVNCRTSVSFTLHMTFIASKCVANAVLAFPMGSTWAAGRTVFNTSYCLNAGGSRCWLVCDDKPVATRNWRLIDVFIASRLSFCLLLLFCNVIHLFHSLEVLELPPKYNLFLFEAKKNYRILYLTMYNQPLKADRSTSFIQVYDYWKVRNGRWNSECACNKLWKQSKRRLTGAFSKVAHLYRGQAMQAGSKQEAKYMNLYRFERNV